jgi:hypothetical protein
VRIFFYFQLIFKTLKITHRLTMICNSVRSSRVWTSRRCRRLHRRSGGGGGGGFRRKSRTTGWYSNRISELNFMPHARTQLPASKKNASMIQYATELWIPPSTWRQATRHQQADDHPPACNWLGKSQELWTDLLGSFFFFPFFRPWRISYLGNITMGS